MALHTKKEFAALCGIKTKDLSVYIGRVKVNVKDDLIDDSDQMNQVFMEKMKSKKELGEPVEKKVRVLKEKKEPTQQEIGDKNTLTEILKEKGELELLQRKNLIQLQHIDIQKKRGELIPTEAVRSIMIIHSESIKTAYTEASDNLIVILSQKHSLSPADVADIRKQFLQIVNKAIDSAIASTKTSIGEVIREFSKKRGVGQHD